jgi:hypothetical protein
MEQSNLPKRTAFDPPQFHSISENDEWPGKGVTEWKNVVEAKPLVKELVGPGHFEPRSMLVFSHNGAL